MEDKRKITLTIIGVATLLILVLSATFAYFSAQTSNDKKTTNVTASTEKVGSIALSNPTGDLHLNLSVSDMAQDNLNTYWATDNESKNYDSEEKQREIAVAELSGGSATAKYECTTTISVELSDTMASKLQPGDGYIQFGELLTDKIDLTSISADGYQVTFKLDGTNTKKQRVTAAIALVNRNNDQSYIAGEKLGITFSNSDLDCQVVSKPTLSETVIALSEVNGSGIYKENISGSYMMPYNVIPANENEWYSVKKSGETIFETDPENESVWSTEFKCDNWVDSDCLSSSQSYSQMEFVPLNDGYYKVNWVNGFGRNFTVSVDGKEISSQDCFENGGCNDVEVGYLTPENTLTVSMDAGVLNDTFYEGASSFSISIKREGTIGLQTYRYEGANVNNYITFNNETWRIIGVEEGSTIGLESGKYYTKIIRNETLGRSDYGHEMYNYMENMLNDLYYNSTGEDYDGDDIEDIGYRNNGLNSDSRSLIVNAKWRIGVDLIEEGYPYSNESLPNTINAYITEKSGSSSYGYVGLMNLSDYGYGALQSDCAEISLSNYSNCVSKNWIYSDSEWLFPYDANGGINTNYYINSNGDISTTEGDDAILGVTGKYMEHRPVVYLNSNVVITKGNGEETNKYEIVLGG